MALAGLNMAADDMAAELGIDARRFSAFLQGEAQLTPAEWEWVGRRFNMLGVVALAAGVRGAGVRFIHLHGSRTR